MEELDKRISLTSSSSTNVSKPDETKYESNNLTIDDGDDDVPRLSSDTLAALQEFYSEVTPPVCKDVVEEDWQLSQFWYDEQTSETLCREAASVAGCGEGRVACLCTPSLYPILRDTHELSVTLFEYDRRFQVFSPDYEFYDYNQPLQVHPKFHRYFDIVIADPPFLSEECLCKVSQTIKYLSKSNILLCTGSVMERAACDLLGVKPAGFKPQHKRNLGNEFLCYTNFDTKLGILER